MWKVGVVGAGYWSDKHLQAWQRIPGVQIQGLCDLDSDKLHSKGVAYGIPGTCCTPRWKTCCLLRSWI